LLDFYTNLDKNVAYGANDAQRRKHDNRAENRVPETHEGTIPDASNQQQGGNTDEEQHSLAKASSPAETSEKKIGDEGETSNRSNRSASPLDMKPNLAASSEEKNSVEEPSAASQPNPEHHKRSQDAVAAAKERFLARKRAKEQ
jgi:coiled-coil domain-containing protein 55